MGDKGVRPAYITIDKAKGPDESYLVVLKAGRIIRTINTKTNEVHEYLDQSVIVSITDETNIRGICYNVGLNLAYDTCIKYLKYAKRGIKKSMLKIEREGQEPFYIWEDNLGEILDLKSIKH